jgi:[ribosomal protein S5]-alanine N-acetyltransferase
MQIFKETERLILRELTPADVKGMFALDRDPDVHQYLGNKPIAKMAEARQHIEFIRQQYRDNGIGRWAVIEKDTNDFIGWAGLKFITEVINNHTRYYDLGYRLIRKYWGKGYATEAAHASLDYGFNHLQLNEIYAMADTRNKASGKILAKAGLQQVETFSFNGIAHDWFKINKSSPRSLTS